MSVRLVRYLAQCGIASRRGAADLVRAGQVEVNGVVTDNVALGIEESDEVRVRGRLVRPSSGRVILMLNKPAGVVTSRNDPHNPRTIYDSLSPEYRASLKAVGRLDKDSTGLLLLTNDGDLAFRLTHPSYGVEKTYRVLVKGSVSNDGVHALAAGVLLDDGPTAPARVRLLKREPEKSEIEITIHEGRNRQVRRMCEKIGHSVYRLHRTRYGPLAIGSLKLGESRELTETEAQSLLQSVGLLQKQS